jgi:hypothetical protein
LNANTGLSTGGQKSFFSLQAKELRVINQRYNILKKIDYSVPCDTYKIPYIKYGEEWIDLQSLGFSAIRKVNLVEFIHSCLFTIRYGILRISKYIYLTLH